MTSPRLSADAVIAIHHHLQERLPMWVIHERPKDYPDGWVARLCVSLPEPSTTRLAIRGATRADVEACLPPGLFFIARFPEDQPQIVGVWL